MAASIAPVPNTQGITWGCAKIKSQIVSVDYIIDMQYAKQFETLLKCEDQDIISRTFNIFTTITHIDFSITSLLAVT